MKDIVKIVTMMSKKRETLKEKRKAKGKRKVGRKKRRMEGLKGVLKSPYRLTCFILTIDDL